MKKFHAKFFDGRIAIAQSVLVEVKDFGLSLSDENGEKICDYAFTNLFRNQLAELNELRISINPRGHIVFDYSHELVDIFQAKAPNIANPPNFAHQERQRIKKIAIFAWGIVALYFLGWPLISPFVTQVISADAEAAIGKNVYDILAINDRFKGKYVIDLGDVGANLNRNISLLAQSQNIKATPNIALSTENEINAFALPGGKIILYCGLVNELNAAETSFVLSHELAHVKNRDGMKNYVTGIGTSVIMSMISGTGLNLSAQFANNLKNKSYSRSAEAKADKDGIKMLNDGGFDTRGAPTSFAILTKKTGGNLLAIDNIFLSHPDTEKRRIESLKFAAENQGKTLFENGDYEKIKSVCNKSKK